MTHTFKPLLAVFGCLWLAACAVAPVPPASTPPQVDLPRFMGTWHVIANIPYWLENGKVATRDVYRLRPDGRIDNDFVFRRGFDRPEQRWQGISSVVPNSSGSRWSVQFVWPFSSALDVLEVSPDYQWALLASPDRGHAWVFSRQSSMDVSQYEDLLARIQSHGVERCSMVRVRQNADDPDFSTQRPSACSN